MKHLIWLFALLLLILHQDYWQWGRSDIVFGFVPYTMAYQMFVSVTTAVVWILAIIYCWPDNVDGIKPLNKPKPKKPRATDTENGFADFGDGGRAL